MDGVAPVAPTLRRSLTTGMREISHDRYQRDRQRQGTVDWRISTSLRKFFATIAVAAVAVAAIGVRATRPRPVALAVASSSGGMRALIADTFLIRSLVLSGVWEHTTHLGAVSGSSWLVTMLVAFDKFRGTLLDDHGMSAEPPLWAMLTDEQMSLTRRLMLEGEHGFKRWKSRDMCDRFIRLIYTTGMGLPVSNWTTFVKVLVSRCAAVSPCTHCIHCTHCTHSPPCRRASHCGSAAANDAEAARAALPLEQLLRRVRLRQKVVFGISLPPNTWADAAGRRGCKQLLVEPRVGPRQPAIVPVAYAADSADAEWLLPSVATGRGSTRTTRNAHLSTAWLAGDGCFQRTDLDGGLVNFSVTQRVDAGRTQQTLRLPARPSPLTLAAASSAVAVSECPQCTHAMWQKLAKGVAWRSVLNCFSRGRIPGVTGPPVLSADSSVGSRFIDGAYTEALGAAWALSSMQRDCRLGRRDCSGGLAMIITMHDDADWQSGCIEDLFGPERPALVPNNLAELRPLSRPNPRIFADDFPNRSQWIGTEVGMQTDRVHASLWRIARTLTTVDNPWYGIEAGHRVTTLLIQFQIDGPLMVSSDRPQAHRDNWREHRKLLMPITEIVRAFAQTELGLALRARK